MEAIVVSAKTGEGFEAWLGWLERGLERAGRAAEGLTA